MTAPAITPTRAFYRSYVHEGRRAGQVRRLHVMREDGQFAGREGLCGIHGWKVTRSEPIILPLPTVPPEGLLWCPLCLERLTGTKRCAVCSEPSGDSAECHACAIDEDIRIIRLTDI